MIIAKVVGHVWATKKEDSLSGLKLMVVKKLSGGESFVAVDVVGAGIGERVLTVSGSTARRAVGKDDLPVDCAIVGIIDAIEVDKEARTKNE
ncbi:MAG: Carbon dioxide concentrating mechanism protein CcmL [Firmicutes bacterium ADurb.Bin182]|nr:MAG: Carbon dioxide concentrating mechanism protein CcmL [Firmicutes bacterium ADurb.Bin182]